ncbi:MAG: hypothetical protein M0Z63_01145 [Actinomycetota bacterium]|jgi:hypothetical protein|nr:hypothetical protein [Actinomycetota bacterium]MDA8279029.1 hypothetical protein [Actinomycetota bacterium]
MPRIVACAVVRDDPPRVFVAEDEATLNWVLALQLVARAPGHELPPELRDRIRQALRDEQWGTAVALWMENRPEVDVYPSFELHTAADIELASLELAFTPLFED